MKQDYRDCHFQDQQPGEEILLITRRHWFDIFLQYIPVIILLSVLLFASIYVPYAFPDFMRDSSNVVYFFETLFLIIIWIYASLIFVDYYLDVWILTDRRIVDIEQKGLFMREVSELYYPKVQDVSTEVSGMFPTFLNYGDVLVQTAAELEKFRFQKVPNPYEIKDMIMELQKKGRRNELDQLESIMSGKQE